MGQSVMKNSLLVLESLLMRDAEALPKRHLLLLTRTTQVKFQSVASIILMMSTHIQGSLTVHTQESNW